MEITIPGKPIAKKRPRFFRRGNFVGTYNSQETEEGRWQLLAKSQIPSLMDGPISLTCAFAMPIPKSASKKFRSDASSNLLPHTKKPDLDNLIKFVKDCLNGLAWQDDSQVSKLQAYKYYSDKPSTWILIETAKAD